MERQRLSIDPPKPLPRQRLGFDPKRLDVYTGQIAVPEDRFDRAWNKYTKLFTSGADITKMMERRKIQAYLEEELNKLRPGVSAVFTLDVRWVVDLLFGSRAAFCEVMERYNG